MGLLDLIIARGPAGAEDVVLTFDDLPTLSFTDDISYQQYTTEETKLMRLKHPAGAACARLKTLGCCVSPLGSSIRRRSGGT